MLISKFTRTIETLLGHPLVFSLLLNRTSDVGTEFHSNRLIGYRFYGVDSNDYWISNSRPPLMFVRDVASDIFKDICLREETEFDFVLDYPMSKREILLKRKEPQNEIYPFLSRKMMHYISFNNIETWVEVGAEVTRISGRINFKSYAGIVKFEFHDALDTIELEVISYKINYEDDFRILLSELAQYHSELIFLLDQPTEVSLGIDQMSEASPQVSIFHLRRLMERNNLPLAIETILANPHVKISHNILADDSSLIVSPDLFEISSNSSGFNWVKGGILNRRFKGFTPMSLPEEYIDHVFDTQENQFVKFFLEELADNIQKLLSTLPSKFQNSKVFLENSLDIIEGYLNEPFFQNISPFRRISNSMIIQKRSGYKDLFRLLQEFELGLQLESNISEFDSVNGDLRPIHKLYEYWCYFSLFGILQKICGQSTTSDILLRSDRGYTLNLTEKNESKISFVYNNSEVNLFYNRDFKKNVDESWEGTYDGGVYHPDFSLQIISQGQTHWIHFDAKYKLDYKKFISMIKSSEEDEFLKVQEGSYKRNDIYTAHAYRDAILGSRGVYILYPDNVEHLSIFTRNPKKDYSFNLPSIGAIPLRPGENSFNKKQQQQLQQHIVVILNLLTSGKFEYQEEVGKLKD